MAYNCILYKSTGFNVVNIPDGPALLASVGNPISVPALDIVQDRFLQTVRVHATYSQVMDVDYAQIGDFYYMVTGIHMLSGDTCQLSLIPDFLTSAGGVSDIDFIDGMTERVHVSDDTYGKYTEHDELMAPAEPLQIALDNFTPDELIQDPADDYIFVESTVDLVANASRTVAVTYTNGTEIVTVPTNAHLSDVTEFRYGPSGQYRSSHMTGVFDGRRSVLSVFEGIQKTRDLGTESAIIAQYAVPAGYIQEANNGGSGAFFNYVEGCSRLVNLNLPYQYGTYTPNNLKVLYSDFTKYGILTTSGDRVEYNPYDVYDSGDTSPLLRVNADPRPDGKPYFRYDKYKTIGSSGLDFFIDCVSGQTWEQVPLVYQGKSGSALTRLQFDSERKMTDEVFERTLENGRNAALIAGAGKGFQTGYSTFSPFGTSTGVAGGIAASGLGILAADLAYDYIENETRYTYQKNARNELLKYAVGAYSSTAPVLSQPYAADLARDVQHNGAWCYRYHYSENDMRRIDKLLTMYGYKHVKALEASDFTSRQDFNYVSARGVEVTGNNRSPLPRWWCEGIAAQLEAGTRIWHVAPDPTLYS